MKPAPIITRALSSTEADSHDHAEYPDSNQVTGGNDGLDLSAQLNRGLLDPWVAWRSAIVRSEGEPDQRDVQFQNQTGTAADLEPGHQRIRRLP
jgi:hypothetical protein